jgi:8-oxo-dGTP pyrophosphatase MutT (NUDIX family)
MGYASPMADLRFDADLRAMLSAHLAGFARRSIMAEERRPAAVAVAVMPDGEGRAAVVLTVRAAGLRRHGGQWACPGGRLDPGETAEAAALRELEEEVGLALPPEHVLGCLDDYATRSGFVMTPVVVWGAPDAVLRPDPGEVASVELLPIEELSPDRVLLLPGPPGGEPVLALSLPPRGLLYAPTAAVLHQFAEVAVRGRDTRVAHFEQPRFAWR